MQKEEKLTLEEKALISVIYDRVSDIVDEAADNGWSTEEMENEINKIGGE